jgi:DNA polymerase V
MPLIALCDCNNFFVSCERLFRPDLRKKPVVVLSSNDGCVVARSEEARAMGIPMGEPYFRIKSLLANKGVAVVSGSHRLYGEISGRVMAALAKFTDVMDIYSIDEAFLNLSIGSINDPFEYAAKIRRFIGRAVGVPISIGIAPSKTLAKLASKHAKKADCGVFRISDDNRARILDETPIGEVWNIGFKSAACLERWGVRTAGDLVGKDPEWVKKILTIRGLLTMMELRGYQYTPLATPIKPPRSMQVTNAFAEPLAAMDDLEKPVVWQALKAGAKLRSERMAASALHISLRHGFLSGEHGYIGDGATFDEPVCGDRELVRAALGILRRIYRSGVFYTHSGVYLSDLTDARYRQRTLWDEGYEERTKHERLSKAADEINAALGGMAVFPAMLAKDSGKWRPRAEHRTVS